MAEFDDILRRAIQVRDAIKEGSNTADLVGGVMVDTLYLAKALDTYIENIQKKINDGDIGTVGANGIEADTSTRGVVKLQLLNSNGDPIGNPAQFNIPKKVSAFENDVGYVKPSINETDEDMIFDIPNITVE